MSEKPARRVDTRDGSATELSITTKIFLRSGSVTREGVFKRFDQGHLKVRIHIRERRLIEEVEVHGLMRRGEGRYRSASGFRQAERSHSRFARNNQQLGARVLQWDARIARARQRHPYVGSMLTPD